MGIMFLSLLVADDETITLITDELGVLLVKASDCIHRFLNEFIASG